MTLADKLANVPSKNKPGPPCKVGSLIHDSSLSDADKQTLEHQMSATLGDPSRVSVVMIKEALAEEGYSISFSGLTRHRRRECRCFGDSTKFVTMIASGVKE